MIENIRGIAFELFDNWKYRVNQVYPERQIQILDEGQLVIDLNNSIIGALRALMKEEKQTKRENSGYDYGFFLGFVQGNLNVQWVSEYLTKSTEVYKELMMFKAMYEYLKLDDLSLIKINAIYEEFMLSGSNFLFNDVTFEDMKIDKYRINEILNTSKNKMHTERFLENNIKKRVLKIVEFDKSNYLPELDRYFSRNAFNELIDSFESNI